MKSLLIYLVVTLAFASSAQGATVILDDSLNVIAIENLMVTNQLEVTKAYNVNFVFASSDQILGVGNDFNPDFGQEEDAVLARQAAMTALNDNNPTPSGAGPQGTDQFFIGVEYDDSAFPVVVVVSVGAEFFLSGQWDTCATGCIDIAGVGIATILASEKATYADFTQVSNVPLPAAAWLFGSALFGLGVIKRKKA
jgi:hypothetical protein